MKYLILAVAFVAVASTSRAEDPNRIRRVRVALALSECPACAPLKPTKEKQASFPYKLDWLAAPKAECECCKGAGCSCNTANSCGADTCPTGCVHETAPMPHKTVPVSAPVAAVEYRVEYQQQCTVDAFGRRSCRMVPVMVPVTK